MEYETTINNEDVTLTIEYTMGQVDNLMGGLAWDVEDWHVTDKDGVKLTKSEADEIAALLDEADVCEAIMAWEN